MSYSLATKRGGKEQIDTVKIAHKLLSVKKRKKKEDTHVEEAINSLVKPRMGIVCSIWTLLLLIGEMFLHESKFSIRGRVEIELKVQ